MMHIITIIGLIASLVTLFAVWGNVCAMYYNFKHFRNGGWRTTYVSGAYIIKSGDLDGKVIYKSSKNHEDYKVYREKGMIEQREQIPPFFNWSMQHWGDDIRERQYPIDLLM